MRKHPKKRILKILALVAAALIALVAVNFLPTFSLEASGMHALEGEWITVHYQQEQTAAEDVLAYADRETAEIAQKLGFTRKEDVRVYLYDSQQTMQMKKYGLIAPLLQLDWYIGDNIGTSVILTSPAHPGPRHTYDSVKGSVTHEIVHACISARNPRVPLWLTEGMALYLTNGETFNRENLARMRIPSYEDTRTRNPIRFSSCGRYLFAHTYIEYLNQAYGWDAVLALIYSGDYEASLGVSQEAVYAAWVDFLEHGEP